MTSEDQPVIRRCEGCAVLCLDNSIKVKQIIQVEGIKSSMPQPVYFNYGVKLGFKECNLKISTFLLVFLEYS